MSLRKQALSGVLWSLANQLSTKGIAFIVSIILARLLLPTEFGLIGMISVFVGIGTILFDAGMTQSLIRTKNPDQADYSTVFFFNLIGSTLIYIIIFFTAPLIATFYEQEILTGIIRLYCLTFVIRGFAAVQSTRLTKEIDFKTQMIVALPSLIISSMVGIVMAYMGYGVWSLVWSAIVNALFSTTQLWYYSKWTPSLVFDWNKFKGHFHFGYKLTLSGISETLFSNIYQIIIGKYFTPVEVGFFTRAETLKNFPVTTISGALRNVTYPLFAKIQDDNERLKRIYKQIMQIVTFIIAPLITFAGVLAEPVFRFLFTEKWLPAVPYFQIICFTGILYPIHAYNLNVLIVKGHSDLFLKLEIIRKAMVIVVVVITFQFGIWGLLWGQIITSVAALYINTYYTGKLINYGAWQQIKDIIPFILIAIIAGGFIFGLDFFLKEQNQLDIIRILLSSILGVIVYMGLVLLFEKNIINDFKLLILRK